MSNLAAKEDGSSKKPLVFQSWKGDCHSLPNTCATWPDYPAGLGHICFSERVQNISLDGLSDIKIPTLSQVKLSSLKLGGTMPDGCIREFMVTFN